MELKKILVISGKSDIYELVSQTKSGAVVESLVDHKRMPVFRTDRISTLSEISLFTTTGDIPLIDVLRGIWNTEEQKATPFDPRKAGKEELFAYFGKVLPDYDRERVHASDVKKVLLWYNQLLAAGKIDNEPSEEEKAAQERESKAE